MATALEQLKNRREDLEILRSDLSRLHETIIKLRIGDPPKGSRIQALAYVRRQIEKMAARSVDIGGTEKGWPDPADAFADGDQITALREALSEVEAGSYPVPLPEGCCLLPESNFDPFAHDRLYNGKLIPFQ